MEQGIKEKGNEAEATHFQIWQHASYHVFPKNQQMSSLKVTHQIHLVLASSTPQIVQHNGKYPFIHANV